MKRVQKKRRIIIDTDIGDDADDALTLAMAVQQPELELMGVTTVFRQVDKRAQLAAALLRAFGKADIPVYEGSGQSLKGNPNESDAPCQWLPEYEQGYQRQKLHAVDFILETLEQYPDTVILAIGPMTNIALAVQKNPALFQGTEIYFMGGAFDSAFPEWNMVCDPEAMDVLVQSQARLTAFGLELTSRCWLETADMQLLEAAADPAVSFLKRLMDAWQTASGYDIYIHDVFPLCALVHPQLFHYRPCRVRMELCGTYTRGTTVVYPNYFRNEGEIPNIQIAGIDDAQQVKKLFLECVTNKKQEEKR